MCYYKIFLPKDGRIFGVRQKQMQIVFFLLKYKIMHFVSNSETVILYIDFTEYSGYHAPAENCRPQIMTQS